MGTASFPLYETRGNEVFEVWRFDGLAPSIATSETARSVQAVVHVRNGSAATETRLIRIVANTVPQVSIAAPANGTSVSVAQNVAVRAVVIDDTLHAGVQLDLLVNDQLADGFALAAALDPSTNALAQNQAEHTFTLNIPANLVGSTLRLRVRASDAQGLVSQSQEIRLTVRSDQPPSVALANPTAGSHHVSGQLIELRANAADDVGIARVDFFVDGQLGRIRPQPALISTTTSRRAGVANEQRAARSRPRRSTRSARARAAQR